MKKVMVVLLMLSFMFENAQAVFAASVVIQNDRQWLDTSGNPIKAQGGGIINVGGVYHWFGPDFGTAGDYKFYGINHYTSSDLKSWTKQSGGRITAGMPTIPFQSGDWIGRPYVMWNAATSKYVMVLEWGGHETGVRNQYAFLTATDLSAGNAWTYQSSSLIKKLPDASGNFYSLGDLGAYQDGANAYLMYTFDKGQTNGGQAILKLSNDFLKPMPPTTGNYSEFSGGTWDNGDIREAASIFKRNGKYYYFTSNTRGWKSSDTAYRTAESMAGPWSERKPVVTSPSSADSFNTQHDFVLEVQGSQGTTYVYGGDRWSNYSGGDMSKGVYAWYPLSFAADGTPTINGYANWTIDPLQGTWSANNSTLQNPGFESDLSSWTYAGNLSIATDPAEVHSGSKSAKSYSTSAYTTLLENTSASAVSGGTYTAKVWHRSGNTFASKKFQVYVNGALAKELNLPTTTTWTEYSIGGINVPEGATIKLSISASGNASAWAQYDDFSLIKG
ncbi:hypothetical protein M3194_02670 [Paenibacillus glycanilyticus]|uniref:hypothetical protein n=1 Tax=Paenibacillus glycanilyticus TaxID=126569 RepID=UPI002040A664|nr:hypothetical protein [Paenibacillus glycanilyticus]MCM3626271.1 hypothetical protein [Paenibacillus glycanilyticus]